MSKTLAVLALTLPAANAAYQWTKGATICAGIKVPCTDKSTCSSVAVGPCPGDADPTAYLESEFGGLAFVNSKKYLDPKTGKVSDATTYKIIEASGPGFRDYKAEMKPAAGGKFGYTMVGNVFGDTDKAGGYCGVVSYLNTGTVNIEASHVEVFGAGTGQEQVDRSAGTDWSDSEHGAPDGPHKVCISEIKADKTCGAARIFKPDEYKFSIFGSVTGSEYDKIVAGKDGFPAGMDKAVVRMQLKATGFAVKDLQVNGKSWVPSMVNDDVKSLFIMHESGGLNIEFPKKYNTGTMPKTKVDALPNTATHDMAIRISEVDTVAQTIMIDYLFDTSKLPAGTWYIYDPDVTEVAKGSPDPNKVVDTGAANAYNVAAATLSAFAAVVGLLM